MAKVLLFSGLAHDAIPGHEIIDFDIRKHFPNLPDLQYPGFRRPPPIKRPALWEAAVVDFLYRRRDRRYMNFVQAFTKAAADVDLLVMATYNPIHPDVLDDAFSGIPKILGFIDDPDSTVACGIPNLHAFDGAFYVSPARPGREPSLKAALERWGAKATHWLPLAMAVPPDPELVRDSISRRTRSMCYVGKQYGPKVDRLIQVKRAMGREFTVRGRWGLKGFAGMARALRGRRPFPGRVRPISNAKRLDLYLSTKIGFNMHLSPGLGETGNMRMYEAPAHGLMLLANQANGDLHQQIYEPGKEAVFYRDIPEALELAEYYLDDDDARIEIALRGHERLLRDYQYPRNWIDLFEWALRLKRPR